MCSEITNFWRYLHVESIGSLVQTVFNNFANSKQVVAKIEHRTHVRWFHNQQKYLNEKLTIANEFQNVLIPFINHLQKYDCRYYIFSFSHSRFAVSAMRLIYKLQLIYPAILNVIISRCRIELSTLQSYFSSLLIHDHNLIAQEKPVALFPKDAVFFHNNFIIYSSPV